MEALKALQPISWPDPDYPPGPRTPGRTRDVKPGEKFDDLPDKKLGTYVSMGIVEILDIEARIASGECDELFTEISAAEEAGDQRQEIYDAIDDRRSEIPVVVAQPAEDSDDDESQADDAGSTDADEPDTDGGEGEKTSEREPDGVKAAAKPPAPTSTPSTKPSPLAAVKRAITRTAKKKTTKKKTRRTSKRGR